mmetsp:Transcript_42687/g.49055  ORF Transcript_42687/g.49055 Transcript_42687/m.49055 type:complete len:339 (+) Transcript_42687:75-1091(+)|eukprot:CAMPEP_0114974614 /NCGR_PEP_ID=MMETSP0216-20121206/1623_1 /TAXON_ID=223996 /ORGANISM="Protocruzia adherens, Strain Boccale" /LENGTH=338 /DNA_ID=CAMNT_0002335267 /DNA_START=33 /DNA_END=1049 /DNA_ORIENTATION=+
MSTDFTSPFGNGSRSPIPKHRRLSEEDADEDAEEEKSVRGSLFQSQAESSSFFGDNGMNMCQREYIMYDQRQKQAKPLEKQKQNYETWQKTDGQLIGKIVAYENFAKNPLQSEWEFANFYPGDDEDMPTPQITGEWERANLAATPKGIQIRSILVRPRLRVSLRSLASDVRISFRLGGESSLWIFSRCCGHDIDRRTAIVKIQKEQDDQKKLFVSFGSAVGEGDVPVKYFKFFKKQQIPPVSEFSSEAILEDFIDVKLRLIDNGDEKIIAQTAVSEPNKRRLNMVCNTFIPVMDPSYVMFAGSGNSVYIKNISIKQCARDHSIKSGFAENHIECCNML